MMKNIFIFLGFIIVGSFITGIVLTVNEKKRKKSEVLTDDPKILFEDSTDTNPSSLPVSGAKDGADESNPITGKVEVAFEEDTSIHENKGFMDNTIDEEII